MAKSADRAEFIARRRNIAAKKAAGKKLYIGDEFVVEGAVASKPEKVTELEPAPKIEASAKTETRAVTTPPLPPKRSVTLEDYKVLERRVKSLEEENASLLKRVKTLEEGDASLLKRVKTLEEGNSALWKRVAYFESRIAAAIDDWFEKTVQ